MYNHWTVDKPMAPCPLVTCGFCFGWQSCYVLFNSRHTLYVEMECSDLFGAGKDGVINPPDPNKYYTLRRADIVVKDPEIYQLLVDFEVLVDLIEVKTTFSPLSSRS